MAKSLTESSAKRAFCNQRKKAEARGIEWEFTFDEWLLWWGDDIRYRGARRGQLQMQRIADKGPYRANNVKKGTPAQNRATCKLMVRNRKVAEAAIRHQERLDSLPVVTEEQQDDEPNPLGYATMLGRMERDSVCSYDGDDAKIQRQHRIPD